VPPEFQIRFPKSRRVVKLAKPPGADRDDHNDEQLQPVSHQKRTRAHCVNQPIHKKDVASPNDRRKPTADDLVAAEQQRFRNYDYQKSKITIEREFF
jgi:hypothetical protein